MAALEGGGERIPLFPLSTVLFPGAILPLRLFEARYLDMAKECLKHASPFGVCLIREGSEVGAPAVPESIGCLARLEHADMRTLGILEVKAVGLERFRILATEVAPQGLLMGRIERLAPEEEVEAPHLPELVALLRRILERTGTGHFVAPLRYEDASWVGFRLAGVLPLSNAAKQELLASPDAASRLALLHDFLRARGLPA